MTPYIRQTVLACMLLVLITGACNNTVSAPTAGDSNVFGAGTGKLPAGVAEKTLNEEATQCKWMHAEKTAGQRIISLHVTPKGTVLGGLHGRHGIYRTAAGTPWEYVPFFSGHEAKSIVYDLISTPAGRIYASVWNPDGNLAIPDQAMELPPVPELGTPTPTSAPTPTPTPTSASTLTPAPSGNGLLASDEDGIAGSWVNPKIWEKGLWGAALTGKGTVYFAPTDYGLYYATGYVEGYPVDDAIQLFPDWQFRRLLLTDTYLFAFPIEPGGGILRMELAPDGAPKILISAKNSASSMTLLAGKVVSDLANDIDGEHLFAATWGSGIFRSQNFGDTWVSKSLGLPKGAEFINPQIDEMAQIPTVIVTHTGLLFASVAGVGVFVSGNNAESWQSLGKFEISQPVVESLAFGKSGSLVAGTTNGIYTYPKNCTSALIAPVESPRRNNRR